MYLRISEERIRFRITLEEAQELLEKGVLSATTPMPMGHKLSYSIRLNEENTEMALHFDGEELRLIVSRHSVVLETRQRPTKEGITMEMYVGEGQKLVAALEIDIRPK